MEENREPESYIHMCVHLDFGKPDTAEYGKELIFNNWV